MIRRLMYKLGYVHYSETTQSVVGFNGDGTASGTFKFPESDEYWSADMRLMAEDDD